jgi:outer membrane receptor protein involved in Fe transport
MSYSGSGVVNVPLSDTMAVRASGFYRKLGGFIDSIGTAGSDVAKNINDSTVDGGRAALLFQPSDDVSIKLSAFLQDIDNAASNIVDSDALTEKTLYGGLTQSQYVPQQQDVRYRVYNATGVFGLGFADLTSATSYGTLTQDFRDDYTVFLSPTLQAIFQVPNESYNRQITRVQRFTQELRLSSHKNDRFEWLAGAYYTDEKGLIDQHFRAVTPGTLDVIAGLPGLGDGGVTSKYQEYAAFANATIGITDKFDLTLGGRYSHNKQSEAEDLTGILVGGHVAINGDSSENVFTYSLAPKFKINDRMALYARVAKGFRPGGPNVIPLNAPPGTPTSYNSDSLVSYEAGMRGDNANRSVSFDMAAFHIDWKDIQLFARVNNIGLNTNASHAKSDGLELATTFRPVQGLSLALSGAYTNAKLTAGTDPVLVGGRDGDQLPYTPKLSFTASADYDWSIASGRDAYVGASLSHSDKTPAGFDAAYVAANHRQRFLPSYETVDAHAGINFGKFSLELFGRNLTNEEGKTSVETGSTPLGQIATGVIRPRSFGLTATAEF